MTDENYEARAQAHLASIKQDLPDGKVGMGSDLNVLRAVSDEYNAWIRHHAAGHSYDDFLEKRKAVNGFKEKP